MCSAGLSLPLYRELRIVARDLSSAEPTSAGEIFSWIPRLAAEGLRQPGTSAELRYLVVVLALFGCYGAALRGVAGARSGRVAAFAGFAGATFLLLQLSGPAMLSSDVYSYVMYGRVFAIYGGDPYSVLSHYQADTYEPLSYWKTDPSFYGPLWTLLSGGLATLGREQIGLTVLLFRAVAVGGALASGALIWACLRRMAPGRAVQGLVFFLWNPLVILESGLSGHNDVVMVTLLLVGIWLHLRGHLMWAVVALVLSGLVKFVSLAILPLYLLLILRRQPWPGRIGLLVRSVVAAGVVTTLVLLATGSAPRVLAVAALGSGAGRYLNGVHELAFPQLRLWLGEAPESVAVPADFEPYWVQTIRPADARPSLQPRTGRLPDILSDTLLLVLAPQAGDWIWVYDPSSRQKGYIANRDARKIGPPSVNASDSELVQLVQGPLAGPIAQQANMVLRAVSWGAFAVVWLLVAWRTVTLRGFVVWSTVILLALYWLVAGWFWPWYVIWALAPAALVPGTLPARLTLLLSGTSLGLYAWFGAAGTDQAWIFTYRSLLILGPPLVILGAGVVVYRLARVIRPARCSGRPARAVGSPH